MSVTKHFTEGEAADLIDGATTIATEPWRHGTHETVVFEHEGAHWRAGVRCHHEDGRQIDGGITATMVRRERQTVLVWVPVDERDTRPAK